MMDKWQHHMVDLDEAVKQSLLIGCRLYAESEEGYDPIRLQIGAGRRTCAFSDEDVARHAARGLEIPIILLPAAKVVNEWPGLFCTMAALYFGCIQEVETYLTSPEQATLVHLSSLIVPPSPSPGRQ